MAEIGPKEIEELISWGKYLYWTELHYQNLQAAHEKTVGQDDPICDWRFLAFLSYWLGSLWVVVEGWKELKFSDSEIDAMLAQETQFLERLRKFRNGVYHFQSLVFDQRFTDLLENSKCYYWAWSLHYEFKRFLWEWPKLHLVTEEQVSKTQTLFQKMIGWFPSDVVPALKHSLVETINQAELALKTGPSDTSEATELVMAINSAKNVLKVTPIESLPHLIRKALNLDS